MKRYHWLALTGLVALSLSAGLVMGTWQQPQVEAAGFPAGLRVREASLFQTTSDVHQPAADTAAAVSYAAVGGKRNCIAGMSYSYDDTPTLGSLTVADDTGTIWYTQITAKGPGSVNFSPGICGASEDAITVTVAAAGAAVTGTLSIHGHWTE